MNDLIGTQTFYATKRQIIVLSPLESFAAAFEKANK